MAEKVTKKTTAKVTTQDDPPVKAIPSVKTEAPGKVGIVVGYKYVSDGETVIGTVVNFEDGSSLEFSGHLTMPVGHEVALTYYGDSPYKLRSQKII